MFRDCYQELRDCGFALYGLSNDDFAANKSFQIKYNLPFTLICDQKGTLIKALGFSKPPRDTARGVIAIDKDGKVLASIAGPFDATVRTVLDLVESMDVYDPAAASESFKQAAIRARSEQAVA